MLLGIDWFHMIVETLLELEHSSIVLTHLNSCFIWTIIDRLINFNDKDQVGYLLLARLDLDTG